jgi:methionyl-tRNA formyltransferase
VPGRVLHRLGFGAYNFHPGPPTYPGWAPSHFAVYDRATSFGVTAHVMHERVDSGPIVDVDLFDIPAGISAEALDEMTYARLARQFFALAQPLATNPEPLPALPVQWCGRTNTRRHCAELCDIPLDISRDELARRMAAFGDGRLGVVPTVTLHGHQFRLLGAETAPAAAAASFAAEQPLVPAIPA